MLASALASKRFWFRDEDDSVYISLPYSRPTSGMFGGPPTTGGPPGSGSRTTTQSERPPLLSRHTLASIKLSFDDKQNRVEPGCGDSGLYSSRDNRSITRRSSSKDDFELLNHRLFRVGGHDCLDPELVPTFDPLGRRNSNNVVSELNGRGHYCEAGYEPQAVPGFPAPRGETDEPLDAWHSVGDHYHWHNLPSRPVADDPYASEPFFMSPPMDQFPTYPGYETVGNFEETARVPTLESAPSPSGNPPAVEFDSVATLNEEQCRDALMDSVGQQCCYGKAAAREMKLIQIIPSSALHYVLETFTETRDTSYKHEPYRGGPVDSSARHGNLPLPWDVPCEPDRLFKDKVKKVEVPHTSTVQVCHACQGRGFNRCYRCQGIGYVRCHHCHGDGRISRTDTQGHHHRDSCLACGGDGRKRCSTCHGDGCIMCKLCRGYRQLRCYIQLTVGFKNHKDEHLVERTAMPEKLVRRVHGVTIFEQTMEQVWPVTSYPIQEINENSAILVEKHRSSFPDSRMIHQRHHLEAVPVTEAHYQWKNKTGKLWVYGKERKVHCPEYPQKCCCGCVIL